MQWNSRSIFLLTSFSLCLSSVLLAEDQCHGRGQVRTFMDEDKRGVAPLHTYLISFNVDRSCDSKLGQVQVTIKYQYKLRTNLGIQTKDAMVTAFIPKEGQNPAVVDDTFDVTEEFEIVDSNVTLVSFN